jgi:hypothetical protein
MKKALAGRTRVKLVYDLEPMGHCYVPVYIDDVLVTFWMRNSLRRVSQVTFPDGVTVEFSKPPEVRWLPPREEFSDWYRFMNGFEHASTEEMISEAASQYEKLRAANQANDRSVEALINVAQQ